MVKLPLDVVAVLHLLRAQQDKISQGENQSCAEKKQCVCIHTNIHDEYYCIHTWMFPITAVDYSFHRWAAGLDLSGWIIVLEENFINDRLTFTSAGLIGCYEVKNF